MKTIDPKEVSVPEFHSYLLGAIIPRPIAFASTMDKEGNVNLSPFSFFNCFGANPPILIFSPARRGRDNTTKHTYDNILEVPEVVINIVNFNIVEQMSLASTEYPKGVDEFIKSGLTPKPSEKVKPPRVQESPVSFECKVKQVINTGDRGGAGNLIICEVLLMHINESILDDKNKIDPYKLDAVARLGGSYYARITQDSIFEIPKPLGTLGIGVDKIPKSIREGKYFSGNELGRLGNIENIPSEEEVASHAANPHVKKIMESNTTDTAKRSDLYKLAQEALGCGDTNTAWKILLQIK